MNWLPRGYRAVIPADSTGIAAAVICILTFSQLGLHMALGALTPLTFGLIGQSVKELYLLSLVGGLLTIIVKTSQRTAFKDPAKICIKACNYALACGFCWFWFAAQTDVLLPLRASQAEGYVQQNCAFACIFLLWQGLQTKLVATRVKRLNKYACATYCVAAITALVANHPLVIL